LPEPTDALAVSVWWAEAGLDHGSVSFYVAAIREVGDAARQLYTVEFDDLEG
jgi:hypothetical protein